jgi:hypothetical protein
MAKISTPKGRITVSGNKVTAKNTAGSRLLNSVKGIFIGIAVVIIFIIALGWNESRNVKAIRAYAEAGKVLVETGAASTSPDYEGRLIAVTGALDYTSVTDSLYGLRVNSFALKRVVEMYQNIESRQGSSTDDSVTYTYSQDWRSSYVNSSSFQNQSYANKPWPSEDRFQQDSFYDENTKLGDFTLTMTQIGQLPMTSVVSPDSAPAGLSKSGDYITTYSGSPKVGAIRVHWLTSTEKRASALAAQRGSALVNYTTKNNTSINRIFSGDMTGAQMVKAMQDENKVITWILRIIFTVLICIGFTMIFGPVNALIGLVPFLGKFLSRVTNKVSQIIGGIVGVALSIVVILVSWITVRPLVLIPVLLIIAGVIVLFRIQKKKNAALGAPAGGAADTAAGGWTCSCGQVNTGKFCAACGNPAPWTCSCGQVNTGKFCAACGKPQP